MTKVKMPFVRVGGLTSPRPAAVIGSVRSEGAGDPEKILTDVHQQLKALNGDVKNTAENALEEAQRAGKVSDETKAAADKLLNEQAALNKEIKKLNQTINGVDSKILDISQAAAQGAGGGNTKAMTLGQSVAQQHEKLKNYSGGTLSLTVSNAVTTDPGSGGGLIHYDEERTPVRLPRRRLLVRSLLTQGKTSSDQIHYRKQTIRTSGAGTVAETTASGASAFGWEKAKTDVRKIATHTNMSEEALADADNLETEIDGELRYLIEKEEEEQIVAGDGVGENLNGLLTEAAAFSAATGLPDVNRIDRLRLAILQVTLED
ncbi:MAG: phage major capsid protein [Planktomarina sp.]